MAASTGLRICDSGRVDPLEARAAIGGGGFGGIGSPRALIGHGLDELGTFEVLDRCLALGVTLVDTAYGYAAGESHRLIGRWLAKDPARRARIAIVDKVGTVERHGVLEWDLSTASVATCAAAGRERMGVDSVDVLMTHAPDERTPIRVTLRALADEVDEGRARHWGVSNVDARGLEEWLDEADRLGIGAPRFVENEYSLLAREDEAEVLPLCRERGIGYLAFSPLAGGVLTGKYSREQKPPADSRLALRPDAAAALTSDVHERIDLLRDRAASRGVSPAGLALAWVLAQPDVRPIVGARTPAHLHALEEALVLSLSPEEVAALGAEVGEPPSAV